MRILLLLGMLGGANACTTLTLEDLDEDMPSNLADRYARSREPYADEADFWFPLILHADGHVARTENGFSARLDGSLGPLGLLRRKDQSATYDARGALQSYTCRSDWLRGLLWWSEVGEERGTAHPRWFDRRWLLGMFGSARATDGTKIYRVLWIPFERI